MIGTIVNTCTIIAGTLVGAFLHRGIKEKYKDMLYTGLGLASLAIGLNATVQNLPKSQYPVLFIVAIAVGGVLGTWLDIDGRFKRIVNRTPTTPTPPTTAQIPLLLLNSHIVHSSITGKSSVFLSNPRVST